jgi:hypothetical protein
MRTGTRTFSHMEMTRRVAHEDQGFAFRILLTVCS